MAATTVKNPPWVMIKGNNWFHQGWLEAVLGLVARDFQDVDNPVLDTDIYAYRDGYNMAYDTKFDLTEVFDRMLMNDQMIWERKQR